MKAGRPTKLVQRDRERRLLQLLALGHGWSDAAERAEMTPAAVLRMLDRLALALPDTLPLEAVA